MSIITLQNRFLTAAIAQKAAEIKSLKDRAAGIEYIWRADPAYWGGSAPVLFPIIGGLKNNAYFFENKTYSLPSHGFARAREWAVHKSCEQSVTFRLVSDDATRENYPFDFILDARFTLLETGLRIEYEVTNTGRSKMYFSIGSHPAFNVPFAGGQIENYYIHFSEPENLQRYFFKDGMHLNETEPIFDNSRQISLTRQIFDRGPIILKNPASTDFAIRNSRNSKQIRVSTGGVPYLAFWSKPGAPFVCIEPWYGVPDNIDTDQQLTAKEGIMGLERGCVFKTAWSIDIIG